MRDILNEQKKTNMLLEKLIIEQQRLCIAIENFIDVVFETDELIEEAIQKKEEYFFPEILFECKPNQISDHHQPDQEPCQ